MARAAVSRRQREKRRNYAVGFCDCNRPIERGPCADEHHEVMRECEIENDQNTDFRQGRIRRNERLSGKRRKNGRPYSQVEVRNMTWKDRYCGPAMFSPDMSAETARNRMEELVSEAQGMKDELLDILADAGVDIATDALQRYAVRAGGRQLAAAVCGPGAAVCTVGLAVVNVASGIWTAWSAWSDIAAIQDLVEQQLERLQQVQSGAQRILDAAGDEASWQQMQEELTEEMRDAINSPAGACIRARRCFLVPYEIGDDDRNSQIPNFNDQEAGRNSSSSRGRGLFGRAQPFNLGDSRGCCPGQTGHHVLPQSWLNGPSGQGNCPGYAHDTAPTACLEGYSQYSGSHGEAHAELNRLGERQGSTPLSMDEGLDIAATAYTARGAPGRS
ncbi:MAG: hypothetical protein AAFY42_12075, partial [Pseudomonadota bacterium]